MKRTLLSCLLLACLSQSRAQLLTRKPDPSFNQAVQTIFFDLKDNFRGIQGELLVDEAEYEKFASTVQLPGAMECLITRFHSVIDTTASWQATMLVTEEFEEAASLYKQLCNQMKQVKLKMVDGSIVYFKTDIEPVSGTRRFSTSVFTIPYYDPRMADAKVEVELVSYLTEFRVQVNIHTKKKDDQIGGI
ncbi:hypothetical protein KJS94_04735 [Flavihumibacter rivuli]|uniref:hypothetical protein n=1 Tax=Flavihumibacter rivuli TaxID=2838156 RepID=UPI001BDDFFE3|nr:hypothetical protein [Flavihumibacter rivuli]ULQ57504.1 hypothetical protein KJS94_04735 [Flavihumibacter rivuli]